MTWAWFLLVAVTMLAWWLADGEQEIAGGTTTAIFLTACVKIWVIGFQFMELKAVSYTHLTLPTNDLV